MAAIGRCPPQTAIRRGRPQELGPYRQTNGFLAQHAQKKC